MCTVVPTVPSPTYRIFTPERLGEIFNQEEIPLRYTPRKMLIHPTTNYLITLETDHNVYPANIKGGLRQRLLEAQQDPPSQQTEDQKEEIKQEQVEVKQEKVEDEKMETDNGEVSTKEGRIKVLEELQQKQSAR